MPGSDDIPAAAPRGDQLASDFTSSLTVDRRLYQEDIAGSIAHARMLAKQGIISQPDSDAIVHGLQSVRMEMESGRFQWRPELEDIHMNVEARLYELIGETAGKLHTGRSRNDQVATDARLYVKRIASASRAACRRLQRSLLDRAERHVNTLMPGYTHMQRAQPVSFAHVLMAYYQMFERDADSFADCLDSADVLPLGSGALAGASFHLDREYVAAELGFSKLSANSMDAVSDRDFVLDYIFAAAKTMIHLSRLAEDIVIWSTAEFGFIRLSGGYSSGSSMMPQKRNPDFAELIRGKSGRVIGSLMSVFTVMKAQPLSYNRDLQEDKPALMDVADTVMACLESAQGMIAEMFIDTGRMAAALGDADILATDYADYLVRERHMAFRDAYIAVAAHFKDDSGSDATDIDLPKLTAADSVAGRDVFGGTAPNRVKAAIMRAYGELDSARFEQ